MEKIKSLTREQKHEIFKLARETYIKEEVSDHPSYVGMCWYIDVAMTRFRIIDYDTNSYITLMKLLPEFKKKKPRGVKLYDAWWDRNNTEIRIKTFDELIKETE